MDHEHEAATKRTHAAMQAGKSINKAFVSSCASVGIGPLLKAAFDMEDKQCVIYCLYAVGLTFIVTLSPNRLELQALIKEYNKDDTATDLFNKIQSGRQQLQASLQDWLLSHATIMGPALAELKRMYPSVTWASRLEDEPTETFILPVPSNLPEHLRSHTLLATFTHAELRMRQAVANDFLRELRTKIGLTSYLKKKTGGEYGQASKGRRGKAIGGVQEKIRHIREQYNATRAKLLKLGEKDDSHNYWPLTEQDCQPINIWHNVKKPTDRTELSQKEVRWIWRL